MPTWTAEQYQLQQFANKQKAKRKHKFKAEPRREGDMYFASQAEFFRWQELKLLERAGAISNLEFQPSFELSKAKIKYRADYAYDQDGEHIIEDINGVWQPRFRVIFQLWEYYGPCKLRVTKRKGQRTIIFKEIEPVK